VERLAHENRSGAARRATVQRRGTSTCVLAFWLLPILAVLVGLILADTARTTQAQSQAGEYHVKAAFLFHFVQLVEWPAGSLGNEMNPVTLCTMGDDPFHGDLDDTLAGKSVGTRRLRVRHLKPADDLQGCQVLFVSNTDAARFGRLLEQLKDGPILTVGESDGFVQRGGMIGFCLVDNKVRFEINLEAAERAKLKISSRLLLLAITIVGNHG
jgi:YfiR/HmsC-like